MFEASYSSLVTWMSKKLSVRQSELEKCDFELLDELYVTKTQTENSNCGFKTFSKFTRLITDIHTHDKDNGEKMVSILTIITVVPTI